MALDPYGNFTPEQGSPDTYTKGGQTSYGASSNYGGSPGAYNNYVKQQGQQAGNYRNLAGQSWQNATGARGSQQDALGLLQGAANGTAPSVAAEQQKQGLNAAIQSQMALAASARGPQGLASAQYNAAANTGALQQNAVGQSAMLRAQEMAQARGQYAGAASDIRGQDLSQAGQQAGLGLNYEQLGQNASLGQLNSQQNAAALAERQWEQQSAMDEAAARSQEGLLGSILGGAAQGGASLLSDANAKMNVKPAGMPSKSEMAAGIGNFTPNAPQTMGGIGGAQAAGQPFNPMNGVGGLISPAQASGLRGFGQGLMNLGQGAVAYHPSDKFLKTNMQALPDNPYGDETLPENPYANLAPMDTGYSGPTIVTPLRDPLTHRLPPVQMTSEEPLMSTSDRGEKQNARQAEPAQMLDRLQPYAYDYKPGRGLPPGRQYGVMAQDLERSPMGASVVEQTPRGKAIDVARATGLHFAAEANLNQRLRALEAKRGQ